MPLPAGALAVGLGSLLGGTQNSNTNTVTGTNTNNFAPNNSISFGGGGTNFTPDFESSIDTRASASTQQLMQQDPSSFLGAQLAPSIGGVFSSEPSGAALPVLTGGFTGDNNLIIAGLGLAAAAILLFRGN